MKLSDKIKLMIGIKMLKSGAFSDSEGFIAAEKLIKAAEPVEHLIPANYEIPYKIIKDLIINRKTHESNFIELMKLIKITPKDQVVEHVDGHEIAVPEPVKPVDLLIPANENDLSFVDQWKNPRIDVSGWPVTSMLEVKRDKNKLIFDHTKSQAWPFWISPNNNQLNGNVWICYQKDDTWIAETWEWTGKSPFSKPEEKADRPDLDRDLVAGDKVCFFISGLIRGTERNVSERSNVVWVEW